MITNRDIVEAYVDATGQRRARDIGNSLFANIFNPTIWRDDELDDRPDVTIPRNPTKIFQNQCMRCQQPIARRKTYCPSCYSERLDENRSRK
jgi:hypothetical protein